MNFITKNYMCIVAQTQGHLHVHYKQFVIHLTFFCLYIVLKRPTFKVPWYF